MTIKEVTQFLDSIAPPLYQESYDNAGLITGNPAWGVSGVLTCLDSTEAVIAEALDKGCNLVIAHHPIIFRGLKKISGRNYVERTVIKAIKNEIAIFAIHTNLDNVYHQGVNARIAEAIGLTNTRLLAPKTGISDPGRLVGSGMIGYLPEPMPERAFLQYLKTAMQAGCIRYTELRGKEISKVAVCGGSGGFLLEDAVGQGADIFVTADFKYHQFFDADGRIIIADIGHYESEQYTIGLLSEILSQKFGNFAVHCTELNTNPVNYL